MEEKQRISFLCIFFLFLSCSSQVMREADFQAIELGQDVTFLQAKYNDPEEKKSLLNSLEEYVYIERIAIGHNKKLFRNYIFTISQGKIIKKRCEENFPN